MRSTRAARWLALCSASMACAGEVRVISAAPDDTSVTIYRDLFALITETRTVDLPAGPVTLVFDGVVETLIPQSALVSDTQRRVAESNFDFDRLTRASLLRKSIGSTVTLTRTSRTTGKASQVAATLVAANEDGVIFRTTAGNEALLCSGIPEKLSFESVPGDLQSTPRLSIRLEAGSAGKRQVRVSYLAYGFAWKADYLAHLDGTHMDLAGWITLHNLTSAGFRNAEVQLVAGKLNLLDAAEEGGTGLYGNTAEFRSDDDLDYFRRERFEEMLADQQSVPADVEHFRGCYPLGAEYGTFAGMDAISAEDIGAFADLGLAEALQRAPGVAREEIEEVVVTGIRASMAVRENLADYQLYRLPVRTDLHARQTKQVAFLHKPEVRIDRFYGMRIAWDEDTPDPIEGVVPASIRVGWRNRVADGLGEPLPAGTIRFLEPHEGHPLFVGDAQLRDIAVDAQAEVSFGRAVDVGITMDGEEPEPRAGPWSLLTRRAYLPLRLRILNGKPRPVVVEIRQGMLESFADLRVKDASITPARKAGDYLWRLTVPANGEQGLSYKVGGRIPDDDDDFDDEAD